MSDSPLNPVDVERKIEEVKTRIANGVRVVTAAERKRKEAKRVFDNAWAVAFKRAEGPIEDRKQQAVIDTMTEREAADDAEIAFKHAERTAAALEKELFAWQSINNTIRTMYNAAGA
jgi:hypothetical protein